MTTDGLVHNKYRSKCYGRGACSRRAGGCDIHAAFDSPTGLIYPAQDTGRLHIRTNATAREITVDPATGKARGVAFVDTETGVTTRREARTVVRGRLDARVGAAAAALDVARSIPNGLGNSSGHVGHNFCEHLMGPSVTGLAKDRVGAPRTLDDGRPGGFYVPRFRNLERQAAGLHPRLRLRGRQRHWHVPRGADARPALARHGRSTCAIDAGAFISMGGFGEVLPRYENSVSLDPQVKDAWGIPVLRFNYKFGDNEQKMAADMAEAAKEMFEAAGFEIVDVGRRC